MGSVSIDAMGAFVKGDSLACYEWEDGDRLVIIKKLDVIDQINNIFLYKVINLDKDSVAAVISDQITLITIHGNKYLN